MSIRHLQTSQWYQALTLSERSQLFGNIISSSSKYVPSSNGSEHQFQKWTAQVPFDDDDYLAYRLQKIGLNIDQFQELLRENPEKILGLLDESPVWFQEFTDFYTWLDSPLSIQEQVPNFQKNGIFPQLDAQSQDGFLTIISPLIQDIRVHIQSTIQHLKQSYSLLPFNLNTIEEVLTRHLWTQLLTILSPTLVLELHVANLSGQLQSEDQYDRFFDFINLLDQEEIRLNIFQEYPVLARQISLIISSWKVSSGNFMRRLCADWENICTELKINTNAQLVDMQEGGDTHRHGQKVLIAIFRYDETQSRLVYKPRDLTIDRHFQDLQVWLNERVTTQLSSHVQSTPLFRTIGLIEKEEYGWVEYIEAKPCTSAAQVQHFYLRQGCYLALLHILSATDFHFENLIASGEHPVLTDLETFFNPSIQDKQWTEALSKMPTAEVRKNSVLQIGLLPNYVWGTSKTVGVETSGLGGQAGQMVPSAVPIWGEIGTDKMHLIREHMVISGEQNLPTLNGEEINAIDYTDQIIEGFQLMYQMLSTYSEQLLSDDGPIHAFVNDQTRVVLRPSQTYFRILQESYHPDLLRNALDRDRFFDKLWLDIPNISYLAEVADFEHAALWRNDIPLFNAYPHSRDIWSDTGEVIPNFFDESGMEIVKARIRSLSTQDLELQTWFIRASLTTLAHMNHQLHSTSYSLNEVDLVATPIDYLNQACKIGDTLEKIVWKNENSTTWMGVAQVSGYDATLVRLGIDLHGGTSGVALFLAYLGHISGVQRYTKLAQDAIQTVRQQIEIYKQDIDMIGAFEGWGGLIYTFLHLGVLWSDQNLLDDAESFIQQLPALVTDDNRLDVIAGSAGCILALLRLYHWSHSQQALEAAIHCGEHLLSCTKSMPDGVSWQNHMDSIAPLTGLSHGNAGYAWALLELHALTDDLRFKTTALEALEYERSLFSLEHNNWPDFRRFFLASHKHQYVSFWCHGASGIGLGRLSSLQFIDDNEAYTEIDAAISSTLANGFGHGHCLCHGDLGNLELLLLASQILDRPELTEQVNKLGSSILQSIKQYGWLCGEPMSVETPGLMTGIAGIGYGLLRLADPERVPSVLTLESPKL